MYSPTGTPLTSSGGKALPFYSSQRVHVKRGDFIKEGGEVIGHTMRLKCVKNKLAVPFKEATFSLIYGVGVDRIDEIAQIAILAGLVVQAGAWFRFVDHGTGEIKTYDGKELKFQGRAGLVTFLKETPSFTAALEEQIRGGDVELPDGERVDEDSYGEAS